MGVGGGVGGVGSGVESCDTTGAVVAMLNIYQKLFPWNSNFTKK